MKKVIALVTVLFCAVAANAGTIVPKVGLDLPGTLKWDSKNYDTKMGFNLGGEYRQAINDKFTVGGGFEYLLGRDVDVNNTSASFGFMPIYATGMFFPVQETNGFLPYAKLNLGYNVLHYGDSNYKGDGLKGGIYWGIGIGTKMYENFFVDLMFSSYSGKRDTEIPAMQELSVDDFGNPQLIETPASTISNDITYTKLGINVGYAFDLNELLK